MQGKIPTLGKIKEVGMSIVIAICGLVVVFGYEIRHRMVSEQLLYLDKETHRLDLEIKQLKEELAKKQNIEQPKKGFKFPFFPEFK